MLDVIAPSCESLFSPFKRFSRDWWAFAVIDEAAIIRSGRAMFPYSASSAWPHACCAMVVGGQDDRQKSKRYRRRRPALIIIQNCSPICNTNPSVIVQFFECDDIDRPDRFAWATASCTCAVSVEVHRSACNSRGVHKLFALVFVCVIVRLRTRLQCVGRIALDRL